MTHAVSKQSSEGEPGGEVRPQEAAGRNTRKRGEEFGVPDEDQESTEGAWLTARHLRLIWESTGKAGGDEEREVMGMVLEGLTSQCKDKLIQAPWETARSD